MRARQGGRQDKRAGICTGQAPPRCARVSARAHQDRRHECARARCDRRALAPRGREARRHWRRDRTGYHAELGENVIFIVVLFAMRRCHDGVRVGLLDRVFDLWHSGSPLRRPRESIQTSTPGRIIVDVHDHRARWSRRRPVVIAQDATQALATRDRYSRIGVLVDRRRDRGDQPGCRGLGGCARDDSCAMNSEIARRRWRSPSGTSLSRHSLLIESTKRSESAFRSDLGCGQGA